jgi:hypothetical protein
MNVRVDSLEPSEINRLLPLSGGCVVLEDPAPVAWLGSIETAAWLS